MSTSRAIWPSPSLSSKNLLAERAGFMIVGVGIDVCDVDRFAESIERRPGLVRRIFTMAEAERPMASKAARFAAKEALAKALGAPDGLSWLDAEVLTDDQGKPSFKIMGTVAARAAELGIGTIHLSMSHDAGIASAVVICEA
jgi:holo-[acyl-carrier protein] synthase